MLHSRADYMGVQDLSGRIPIDEPVFLLRAQDAIATNAISAYLTAAGAHNLPSEFLSNVRTSLGQFKTWQAAHPPKLPDIEKPVHVQPAQLAAAASLHETVETMHGLVQSLSPSQKLELWNALEPIFRGTLQED